MEEKSRFGLGLYVHDTLNVHLIGIVLKTMHSAADCCTEVAGKTHNSDLCIFTCTIH
jgi:hypothetical protein